LEATEQQLAIGTSEIEVAQRLRSAEETRYMAGASDVFRLNAQETALANSKLRVLSAQRNHDLLLVEYYRTTGTLWF
jgi:outer membrane protein TolC